MKRWLTFFAFLLIVIVIFALKRDRVSRETLKMNKQIFSNG